MTHQHTLIGKSKKNLIVYLHGWMSNGKSIVVSRIFESLLSNHCLFSPDFPGSGGLPFKPLGASFQAYARWVLHLIEQYFPGRSFHLVGNSMGGMIAQELFFLFPQRVSSLILAVTSACPFKSKELPSEKIWKTLLKYRNERDLKKYLISIIPFMVVPQHIQRAQRILTRVSPIVFPEIAALDERYEALKKHDTRNHLNQINIPTLVIGAEKDQLVPVSHSQYLAKAIPQATLKILKNSGHSILIDAYREAKKSIHCFLESQAPHHV